MERKAFGGTKNREQVGASLGQMPPAPPTFLLCFGRWWFLGWWDVAHVRAGFKQTGLYPGPHSLNMSYCTDWSKFRSFCCQLELKTIWSVGHGQGLETHAPPQPRHIELPCSRIPRGFLPRPFYGISPGGCCQKRFYSSRPNRCRCFPRCKKRVRLLSKLQNPSPSSAPAQESLPPFKSRL